MMSIINSFLWHRQLALIFMAVITVNVYTTYGQSYLLAVGQNEYGYFDPELIGDPFVNNSTTPSTKLNFVESETLEEDDDKNSTLIVIKSTLYSKSSELSQTAMDVITIIWYVATFLALAAFFLLMACSDRRCGIRQRAAASRRTETPNPPPTPSPSYSEFAPPSYESVVKLPNTQHSIYVVPFPLEDEKDDNNNRNHNSISNNQMQTSVVTFYTINELQKLGS